MTAVTSVELIEDRARGLRELIGPRPGEARAVADVAVLAGRGRSGGSERLHERERDRRRRAETSVDDGVGRAALLRPLARESGDRRDLPERLAEEDRGEVGLLFELDEGLPHGPVRRLLADPVEVVGLARRADLLALDVVLGEEARPLLLGARLDLAPEGLEAPPAEDVLRDGEEPGGVALRGGEGRVRLGREAGAL